MASFTLQTFKAGLASRSLDFADEQSAYAETMRLQKSGTVDSVKLIRVKDQKVLFDTTRGMAEARRSRLVPALLSAGVLLGVVLALLTRR